MPSISLLASISDKAIHWDLSSTEDFVREGVIEILDYVAYESQVDLMADGGRNFSSDKYRAGKRSGYDNIASVIEYGRELELTISV